MCRSIRPLFNFDPPATEAEIHAASVQFVRKISGFHKPARVNERAFAEAVEEIEHACARLLAALETTAPKKNREEEAVKAREKAAQRYAPLTEPRA
jgi:hypothetical protein